MMAQAQDYSFEKVCHDLVKEPYNLSFSEIKYLCPYQVRHIFFRPESDDAEEQTFFQRRRGKKKVSPKNVSSPYSYREVFYKVWTDRGEDKAQIDVRWKDYLKANPPSKKP